MGDCRGPDGNVGLLPFSVVRRDRKTPEAHSGPSLARHHYLRLLHVSLSALLLFRLGVAVGTVVCVGATPIMSAIVAKFVLGHSPRPIWYVATLIAVVGIGLLNIKSFEAGNLGWVIVPLLGAMVYGIYMNASPEVSSHMQPEAGIMIGLCMISVMLAPVLVLFPIDWIWSSPRGLLVSAAFDIAGGLGFGLFFLGMKTTAPVVSATLSLAEPMGAACLGIFLLGEDSSLPTIAGIALIIGAILILILDGARVEKEAKKAAG